MKKVFVILTALTLVFALAIGAGAANLSSNWKNIAAYTASGYTAGAVAVDNNGGIILDSLVENGNFNHAGIAFKDKVAVDGLTIVLDVGIAHESLAGAAARLGFGLLLSGGSIGGFVAESDANSGLTGQAVCPKVDAEKTATYFAWFNSASTYGFFSGFSGLSAGLVTFDHPVSVAANSQVTIKYVVNGDNIDVYFNGTKAEGFSVAKADVLDANGKANLAIFNDGLGWAGQVITVKTVNGVAANSFTGSTSSDTPAVPDTADIDVVVIAGAAIVALAAAAFVLKAKKA